MHLSRACLGVLQQVHAQLSATRLLWRTPAIAPVSVTRYDSALPACVPIHLYTWGKSSQAQFLHIGTAHRAAHACQAAHSGAALRAVARKDGFNSVECKGGAAGDVDDDNPTSEALKQMFGLSQKDEEAMTPPEVEYESDEEDKKQEKGSATSSSGQTSDGDPAIKR